MQPPMYQIVEQQQQQQPVQQPAVRPVAPWMQVFLNTGFKASVLWRGVSPLSSTCSTAWLI